jgi:hypothetical protein
VVVVELVVVTVVGGGVEAVVVVVVTVVVVTSDAVGVSVAATEVVVEVALFALEVVQAVTSTMTARNPSRSAFISANVAQSVGYRLSPWSKTG